MTAPIGGWSIVAADAGFGVPPFEEQQGDALLIQGGERGPRELYRMPWQEDDSDRTGHGGAKPILLETIGTEATDALVPVRNGPFWKDPARWLFWREGATVHGFGTASEPQEFTLSEAPAALLRPALQPSGGDILVFALSAGRQRLDRLRFPRKNNTPPIMEGSVPLPVEASAGTAAFAAGGVLVGLSAPSAEGTTLLLLNPGSSAPPRMAVVARARPMPFAPPALHSRASGEVTLGALVITPAGIALAEARFSADPAATPAVAVRQLGQFTAPPTAGALLYAPSPSEPAHVAQVVLRLADDMLLHLNQAGMLEPTTYEARPVPPLVLAPAKHGAFILCCDPAQGPFMAEA